MKEIDTLYLRHIHRPIAGFVLLSTTKDLHKWNLCILLRERNLADGDASRRVPREVVAWANAHCDSGRAREHSQRKHGVCRKRCVPHWLPATACGIFRVWTVPKHHRVLLQKHRRVRRPGNTDMSLFFHLHRRGLSSLVPRDVAVQSGLNMCRCREKDGCVLLHDCLPRGVRVSIDVLGSIRAKVDFRVDRGNVVGCEDVSC
jgi:hypothetical protein